MDIANKIEELKAHVESLEESIKDKRNEINQTRLTIRRLMRHLKKADEILGITEPKTVEP